MRKIDIRLFFSAFVTGLAVLLLTGCTKENGIKADSPLSFSANVPEMVKTKSDPLTSVKRFVTAGYEGETQWFPESGEMTVSLSGGGTAIFPDYIWENGSNKTFYAYTGNLFQDDGTIPNDNFGYYQAEISKNGVTLNCCAQSALAENQRDVLLGRYSGTGEGTGTAELKFYHPLAQVVFNVGNMIGVSAISKIRIGGVFLTGSTRLDMSTTTSGDPAVADFVWTGLSFTMVAPPPPDRDFVLVRDYVYQTITGDLPSSGSQVGIPFFLIPQNLDEYPVTIRVTATVNGISTDLEAPLESGAFLTGKKTVCTLDYSTTSLACTLSSYALESVIPDPNVSTQEYGENADDDIFSID